jgi:hypothetical protein
VAVKTRSVCMTGGLGPWGSDPRTWPWRSEVANGEDDLRTCDGEDVESGARRWRGGRRHHGLADRETGLRHGTFDRADVR